MAAVPETPIPDPPWWDSPRRGEPRSVLTREAIVTAAIEVLDEVGLAGLSMRRVAAALGTGAASLYWHIADKDQLIDLMLDRIMSEVELPEPDPAHWQDQVRLFAREGRAMLGRHRDIALASLGRVPMGPSLVRIIEWFLELLRGAGIPDRAATWFPDLFALVGAAQALEDDIIAGGGAGQVFGAMNDYLASLPADRFPNIAAVGSELNEGSADDRFDFGVELLIRGLATFMSSE
jgi:AcrR family transcriptional regulator